MFKARNFVPEPMDKKKSKRHWPWVAYSTNNKVDNVKVSILMPSFRQGKYLEEAIRSVLCSPHHNLELIILDGGSDDESVNILEYYSESIKFWASEKDSGQSHALSKALSHADGDLIGWLNSDDLYTPDAIFSAVSSYKIGYTCSYGDRILINKNSEMIGWSRRGAYNPHVYAYNIASETFFWNKSVKAQFDISFQFAMDVDFISRILLKEKIHYSKNFRGCFRCHEDSKSTKIHQVGAMEADKVYQNLFNHAMPKLNSPHPFGKWGMFLDLLNFPFKIGIPFLKHKSCHRSSI